MTKDSYFEQNICKFIPLDQVIDKEEHVQWKIIPSRQITARILINNAKIQYIFFLSFFIVVEILSILFLIQLLIQNNLNPSLYFFLLLIIITSCVIAYLSYSFMQLKESTLSAFEWFSEYALTEKRLYLKMTRVFLTKKNRPVSCRIRIVDLHLIRAIKLYRSFWDRHYKETGSFKIKLISPYPSTTLHNLPTPEIFMTTITNALNAISSRSPINP